MTPEEVPLSLRTLARALGLPVAWLKAEAEAEAGRIPSLKAGRRRLLNEAADRRVLLDRAEGNGAGDMTDCSGGA